MGYALRRIRLRGGNLAVESVATLPWNDRQLCDGISGNFAVESMATFAWNQWQLWCGIGGNFRAEYASRKTSGVDGLLNGFSGHCSHPTGYGPVIKRRKR
jgi:hypothetical protein